MSESHESFREQLLKAEQPNPTYREKYDKEVRQMLEQKLTGARRLGYIGAAAMGVGFALLFGTLAIIVPKEFPIEGRLIFAMGAIFGLAWAVFAGGIVRKGVIKLKTDPTAMAGMSWGLCVIVVTVLMVSQRKFPDPIIGVRALVSGLGFLVMAAVFMIANRIDQAGLKTREKLLEIEYRLAELAEQMGKKKQSE
ncbi:hypothetical protein HQ563_10505 [bacterium]|nr:hypothetical protein [bacterium]